MWYNGCHPSLCSLTTNWHVWNWLSDNYLLEKFSKNYTQTGYKTEKRKKTLTVKHRRGEEGKKVKYHQYL